MTVIYQTKTMAVTYKDWDAFKSHKKTSEESVKDLLDRMIPTSVGYTFFCIIGVQ